MLKQNDFQPTPDGPSPDEALRQAGLVLSAETQRLYPNVKKLIWVNKPELFENLRDYAESHGIRDTFAPSETIQQLLGSRNPVDRAMADRLMTESIMRTAKEISSRSNVSGLADKFKSAMLTSKNSDAAQDLIETAIDEAGPQHPMYADMRKQYEELLDKGNKDDPKLASLRVNMARVRREGIGGEAKPNQILVNVAAGTMRWDIHGNQGSSLVIIGEGQVGEANKSTPIGEASVQGIALHQPWRPTIKIAERRKLMDKIPELLASGATYYVEPNGTRFEFDPKLVGNPNVSPFKMAAGPNNPMGAIKVSLGGVFGNSNIYIHDTPDKHSAFSRFAQSSGCIRTEGITQLATALTNDPHLGEKYGYANNQAFFDAAKETVVDPITKQTKMRYDMSNVRVQTHNDIRAKTVYQTVTWDAEAGKAIIHNDIYKRDAQTSVASRNAMPEISLSFKVAQQPAQTLSPKTNAAAPGYKT